MSHKKSKTLLSVMVAVSAMAFYASSASAEDMKFSASAIGRPPIFSNTFVDVGEAKGYWKKAGLDMNFRWFQRGTDTAKAGGHRRRAGRLHRDTAGREPDRFRCADRGNCRHAQSGLGDRLQSRRRTARG